MADFAELRERMIERQIAARGIRDPAILDAFRQVPRELFVSPGHGREAYGDHPLPIEAGQTISQPYIVALMIEAAGIKPGDRVLEVGAGSGYAAAVISRIADRVIAIERKPELVAVASERMERLGYCNVTIVEGDGTRGWPDDAPYDSILAAASGSHVPQPLVDQLVDGGRLVMPVGSQAWAQELVKVTRRPDGTTTRENLGGVRFVPLIGEEGFTDAGQRSQLLPELIRGSAEPLPGIERWSHCSEAILPRQFEAGTWFDQTNAVTPLPGKQRPGDEETYPFGL